MSSNPTDNQQQLNDEQSVQDERQAGIVQGFGEGYEAALHDMANQLDDLREQTTNERLRGLKSDVDEDFVRRTVEWAKGEWPTLKDAVDVRLHQQQPPARATLTQGLVGLAMVRLIDFLDKAGVSDVVAELHHTLGIMQFYSEQFATMLQGTALLTGEQLELPPLAQGLAALQHLMVYKAEIEAREQREAAESQLWAAASNLMNERLAGEPESLQTDLPLIERFTLYLERLDARIDGLQESVRGEDN